MLLGITGNQNAGKDTVAKMIQYYFYLKTIPDEHLKYSIDECLNLKNGNYIERDSNWQIKKFAFKLKQIAAILVGCNPEDFESQEFKDKLLSDEWQKSFGVERTNRTNRWLLKQLGTEAIRNNIHENTWINALFCDLKPDSNWIISDVRFINEAKAIKDRNGIIIKINRPSITQDSSHSSETELLQIKPDVEIINDKTIEDLYEEVKAVMCYINL